MAKKWSYSDIATACWNLLIFCHDMAFTSMRVGFFASWIVVSLASVGLPAQCSVRLAN